MVDETGKGEGRKVGAAARGRSRAAAKTTASGTAAATPVLPPVPEPGPVPQVLADPEPAAPTPVVVAPAPVAVAPADLIDTPFESAAPVASVEKKEVHMNETVTSFAEKAQEQTRTAFANVGEQTRGAVEKTRKAAEDMAEFGKGNVEALVESTRIAAQALETMGQDAATFARTRYESTAQMIQSLASVKSPTEAMQIQAEYVRTAFDALVKEASRSTEATLKLAGDVAKPLQNRLATATEKFRPGA